MAKAKARNSSVTLPGAKKATAATEARLYEISRLIVDSGYSRTDVIDYCSENWGISRSHSEKYYYGALHSLIPKNPEQYREALVARNFNLAENILKKALERNDFTNANAALKILNSMLGVGSKAVEIKDKEGTPEERTITISFND